MSVTNQQLADWLKENCEAQRQATQMFTATVDRFIEHDRENHTEFRQAIVLMQEQLQRHSKNWEMLWKIAVLPVLLAVVGGVLALVLNSGG